MAGLLGCLASTEGVVRLRLRLVEPLLTFHGVSFVHVDVVDRARVASIRCVHAAWRHQRRAAPSRALRGRQKAPCAWHRSATHGFGGKVAHRDDTVSAATADA
jgi:hypothetical protein